MNMRLLTIKLYKATREHMELGGIKLPRFGDLREDEREAWVEAVQRIASDPKLIRPKP